MQENTTLTREQKRSRASAAVGKALREGTLHRSIVCEHCKKKRRPLEAHHFQGYEQDHWLSVQWLCLSCHRKANEEQRKQEAALVECKQCGKAFLQVGNGGVRKIYCSQKCRLRNATIRHKDKYNQWRMDSYYRKKGTETPREETVTHLATECYHGSECSCFAPIEVTQPDW